MKDSVYPCTIIADRYMGSYSGALWTAWNMYSAPEEADSDDITCMYFWQDYKGVVGKGNTPQEAYDDLERKVKNEQ